MSSPNIIDSCDLSCHPVHYHSKQEGAQSRSLMKAHFHLGTPQSYNTPHHCLTALLYVLLHPNILPYFSRAPLSAPCHDLSLDLLKHNTAPSDLLCFSTNILKATIGPVELVLGMKPSCCS
ncbi:hypothetical protein CHARACLAT_031410 [Characodon lateralis]|uniref:Uncharacterized protein n=1 Tax=Characodon lateralis TaxID=208331 RepID=A0ABU7E5A7_9TELE|nr:hypothetical protein [Characodon lateralis]